MADNSQDSKSYSGKGLPMRDMMLALVGGEIPTEFEQPLAYEGTGIAAREQMLSLLVKAPTAADLEVKAPEKPAVPAAEPKVVALQD